jgi:hypothetical protein
VALSMTITTNAVPDAHTPGGDTVPKSTSAKPRTNGSPLSGSSRMSATATAVYTADTVSKYECAEQLIYRGSSWARNL